jgi:hypothetical protein
LPAREQEACWAHLHAEASRENEELRRDPLLYDEWSENTPAARPHVVPTRHPNVVPLRSRRDDPLLEVPAPVYFAAIAGVDVSDRGGVVRCPLPDHEDGTPSCQVYAEPERGWHCFGCHRGGTVYDLAAALWGYGTRGEDFQRLRRLVLEELAA